MHKKQKKRRMWIFGLSVLVSIMIISMTKGEEEKVGVLAVKQGAEIDISKNLDDQLEKITVINVPKNVSFQFGNSVARSKKQLLGKRLVESLEGGTPIPLKLLVDEANVGEFAAKTIKYHTVYRFPGAVGQLPPGVSVGDKIDIALFGKNDNGEKEINMFMEGVEIEILTDTDIYLKVSQNDYNRLLMAKEIGQFILQLPGQKSAERCLDLTVDEVGKIECYLDEDKPGKVTMEEIKKMIEAKAKEEEEKEKSEENEEEVED